MKTYTFGKQPKDPKFDTVSPGPGAYEAKDEVVKSGSHQAKIGSGPRGDIVEK